MPLEPLSNKRPFLKLGINGFAGDGKSFTAAMIAVGLHRMIRSTKPIAIYDTEKAAKALTGYFRDEGIEALVDDTNRSLKGWNMTVQECIAGAADILITDSITHIWEDYVNSFKEQRNRTRLTMEDWGILKPKWRKDFSEFYVMAPLHIIFTGRAGFEYEFTKDENGKKEIQKSGVKMKAEGETAFEPDILILMTQVEDLTGDEKKVWRQATVQKDRSRKIDGMTLNKDGKKLGPEFEDFEPAIKYLLDGAIIKSQVPVEKIVDTFDLKADPDREKKQAVIAEVGGLFRFMGLMEDGDSYRQVKAWTLKQIFGDSSFEMISRNELAALDNGLAILKIFADRWNDYTAELKKTDSTYNREQVIKIMNESKTLHQKKLQSHAGNR